MDLRIGLPKIRIVPSSEERMRTLVQGADHAEAWAEKARAHAAPYLEKLYAVRRRAATGAVAIIAIWLVVHAVLGANGVTVYRAKRAEYQSLQGAFGRRALIEQAIRNESRKKPASNSIMLVRAK